MRLLSAFFLSIFIYSAILFFFLYFIFLKKNEIKTQIVYIHKAIIINKTKKQKNIVKVKKKHIKKIEHKKIEVKETKTKDILSKGGENIKIDDIFSNISDNIKTEKVEIKQTKTMTKKTGDSVSKEIHQQLSTLKSTQTVEISVVNVKGSKSEITYLQKQFYKLWMLMDVEANKEIDIQVNISKGVMQLYVIATNLDTIRVNDFINKLKSVDVHKIDDFNAKFIFKSKLKG